MNLRLLTLTGVATVGGGSAITYGIIKLKPSNKDIAQRLKKEGFSLLTSSSSQGTLDKVLGVYKTLSENNGKTPSSSNLLEMCGSLIKKNYGSGIDYKKSKRFCVVPKSVSSSPRLKGKTILSNGENDEGDKEIWGNLKIKYLSETNSSKRIKELNTLTGSSGEEWKALRNGCRNLLAKDSTDEDYEGLVDKSLTWCIKDAEGLKLSG